MDLQEYQAKKLLEKFSLPTSPFYLAKTKEDVEILVENHALVPCVVKAQVLAGGRGKAGGVKLCQSKEEILHTAERLLGKSLVTKQTGPQGVIVREILLTLPVTIERECYFSIVLDRARGCFSLIVSREGGVDIEEVASRSKEKILVIDIDGKSSFRRFHTDRVLRFLGLGKESAPLVNSLVDAFFAYDCTLLEINPLVVTKEGECVLLDAKMTVDDNALYRQPEVAAFQKSIELTDAEKIAKQHDLSYISLDGSIGCMVNGAGLAMATMDLIRYWGGEPANFLDVGGGASIDKVTAGFQILLNEPKVKAILVNIFGGIMNCEIIALSLKKALATHALKVPLIVRMEGTNVESARKIVAEAVPQAFAASSLDEAAEQAVKFAGKLVGHHGNINS